MVNISKVFRTIGNNNYNPVNRHLPMLNEISDTLQGYFNNTLQTRKKKFLMNWYKRIPELNGLINKVARDINGEYEFIPVLEGLTGRNKIKRAIEFAEKTAYNRTKFSLIVDSLVTGEAFAWIGKMLNNSVVMNQVEKEINSRPFLNDFERKLIYNQLNAELKQNRYDEDLLKPRLYRQLASSTMEVKHDTYDIIGYCQHVRGLVTEYSPAEVIRTTYYDIDGKVNGFSPVESVVVQLELLRFMWENMMAIHRNGGHMDKLFVLEDTKISDPAYKKIRQQLEKYKLVENKHGNMVFTGKVNVQDLQQLDKMQFLDMGLYITGVLALQWEIPKSSIPFIVGGSDTKDDTGGNSERGYWDNIEYAQALDAQIDNQQLWIPYFGVKKVYKRKYIQKDVQMETAKQLKLGNLSTINQLLMSHKKILSKPKLLAELNLMTDDVADMPKEELELQATTTLNNQVSRNTANDSSDKTQLRNKKKQEQQSTQGSIMKPTGTGKIIDLDNESMLEFKSMIGMTDEIVDLDTFIKRYNHDKSSHSYMPRLFMRQNESFTSFKFKSTDYSYKVIIPTEELENNMVRLMNLGGNIYKLN